MQVRGNEIIVEHVARGTPAEAFDVQRTPMPEALQAADRVNARDEAAQPAQRFLIFEFRGATRSLRIESKVVAAVLGQRRARYDEGRDDRNLPRYELQRECVLLQYRCDRPASRPIELRNQA